MNGIGIASMWAQGIIGAVGLLVIGIAAIRQRVR